MKLRHPLLIRAGSLVLGGFIRGLMSTVRTQVESFGQQTDPWDPTLKERFIYVFWHENLAACAAFHSVMPATFLISRSSDGELISQVINGFGVETVRGSSSSGGIEAVDELIEISKRSHIIVAPDGPRGPRREMKRGLVYLAAWTNLRIVPLGIGFNRAWRANSWDRTAVPKPFSRLAVVGGPVMQVPQGLSKAEMEARRKLLEQHLTTATEVAQKWAENPSAPADWPMRDRAAA